MSGYSFPSLGRILLDPDEPESAGGKTATEGVTQADATTTPESSPVSSGQDLGGAREDSFQPTPGEQQAAASASLNPQQPAQANEWQSIRDAARSMGFDLSQFQDDRSALTHLVQQAAQAQQANYYAQLGQQLAPHAQDIQTYLQQRQAPAQPQQRNEWEPPEFDERWMALVDRDPATGLYVGKPGTPSAIVERVNQFAEWSNKFSRNPFQAIQQYQSSVLPKLVGEAVQRQLGDYQRQQAVDQIVAANTPWMYQHDESGAMLRDYRGQPMPTPAGTRYVAHVRSLRDAGITDPRQQDSIARQLLMGEIAIGKQQAPVAPATTTAAINRPNTNPLQTQPPQRRVANPAATEPDTEGMSLTELLRQEFTRAGITDADFQGE